jgi:hypothetical protein
MRAASIHDPPPPIRTTPFCGLRPRHCGSGKVAGSGRMPTTRDAKGHETPGGFAAFAHHLARCATLAQALDFFSGLLPAAFSRFYTRSRSCPAGLHHAETLRFPLVG